MGSNKGPLRVKSAVLSFGRSLAVYPNERTSAGAEARSCAMIKAVATTVGSTKSKRSRAQAFMAKQSKAARMPGEPVITDEVRKVAELKVDPRNARRHSEEQISQIVQSIEKFGYVNKIICRDNGHVIGGHARLEALKRMGRDEAECRVVAGLSDSAYKAMGVAFNRIPENSRWDDDILREVLGELQEQGEDAIGLGFSRNEISKILAEPDELEVKEIQTGPVDDEFWISIRGPLAHQAHALKALQEAMKPYDGVTVEQGTIVIG
jgi:hypothetical protein